MIVDSSAIVAIAMEDPDAERLLSLLLADPSPRISAGNMLEIYMVIDRRWGERAPAVIERTVLPIELIAEPVTEGHVEIARDAWRRYGKGSGHPAQLNYSDCFAYALARERGEPLPRGNDFSRTDIASVMNGESG